MVKREIIKDILPWLGEKKLIVIKGARQVGKTTLLFQIKDILEKEGNQVIYFSADQEITNPIFKEPKLLIKFLDNEHDIKNKKSYLFLDEVQYIKSTGLFLKVLFDITKNYLNIVVSGSSLLKLSENKEFLTGRKIEFNLSSFSLLEHLWAKSSYKYDFSWDINDKIDTIKDEIEYIGPEYLIVDTPGQIELFAYRSSGRLVSSVIAENSQPTSVFLIDPSLALKPEGFSSVLLLSISVAFQLALPQIIAISKADIIEKEQMENLESWIDSPETLITDIHTSSQVSMSQQLGLSLVDILNQFKVTGDLFPISSNTGYNIDTLIAMMERNWGQKDDFYE